MSPSSLFTGAAVHRRHSTGGGSSKAAERRRTQYKCDRQAVQNCDSIAHDASGGGIGGGGGIGAVDALRDVINADAADERSHQQATVPSVAAVHKCDKSPSLFSRLLKSHARLVA